MGVSKAGPAKLAHSSPKKNESFRALLTKSAADADALRLPDFFREAGPVHGAAGEDLLLWAGYLRPGPAELDEPLDLASATGLALVALDFHDAPPSENV